MATVCIDEETLDINGLGQLTTVRGIDGLRERVIFQTAGITTFEKADYPGLQRVFVQAVGGGGGASGASGVPAGSLVVNPGGSGAAYAEALIQASALGASESVAVGAPGASGTPGGNGGSSSFGAFVVAPGGIGGAVGMAAGTTAATAAGTIGGDVFTAVGDVVAGGAPGGGAIRLDGTAGISGQGGASFFGAGGFARATPGPGTAAQGRGAGAGGSLLDNSIGFVSGQSGGTGLVIVWLYF